MIKVFILGNQRSGKTELAKQLDNQAYVNTEQTSYHSTLGADFYHIKVDNHLVQIWDSPGDERYSSMVNCFMGGTHVAIYCVNLSAEVTQDELLNIKKQINNFKNINPGADLILVGTHYDKALPGTCERICEQLNDFQFAACLSISTRTPNSSVKLRDFLISKDQEVQKQINQNLNKIMTARNRCRQGSDLYNALDHLNNEALHGQLNEQAIEVLGTEAHILLDTVLNPNPYKLEDVLNVFVTHCNEQLPGRSRLKAVIMSIAITATLTAVAAAIGFGIGLAVGAWSGPGAFFSGIVLGKASAMWVLAATSVTSVGTISYSSYRFLNNPVKNIVDKFVEEVAVADLSL